MYGVILLDCNGNVLCLVILWNDMCVYVECVELEVLVLDVFVIIGNCVMLGFMVFKLLWLLKYELVVYCVIDKVLLFKDYLGWKLMGEFVFEMLDVVGMFWLDVV